MCCLRQISITRRDFLGGAGAAGAHSAVTASQTTPLDPAINTISTTKPPQHVLQSLNTCGTRYTVFFARDKYPD
jgi:hypothetical protein